MQTNVIGSDRDERYWFHAQIVACRASYRQLYGVPERFNPWALRARSRVTRDTPTWEDWTPRAGGFLVDLFQRDASTREHNGRYEHVMEYVACVVAETSSQARSRLKIHLEHGSFPEFDLHEIDPDAADSLESTSATTQAINHQMAVHPLIGGEYTPHVPEIHLGTDTSGMIAGVIRLLLSTEQLETQIARARNYRQHAYDWGRCKLSFDLNQPRNDRLLTILNAIADNERGTLVGSVSLTEEPDVGLALVLDNNQVDQMLQIAMHRTVGAGETAQWKVPLVESSLEQFLAHTKTALETETPAVVGPSPFLNGTDDELIAAMVSV